MVAHNQRTLCAIAGAILSIHEPFRDETFRDTIANDESKARTHDNKRVGTTRPPPPKSPKSPKSSGRAQPPANLSLPRSVRGLSLYGSENHTAGRHNRCSHCNYSRRCFCYNRANRHRDQSRVCHSTALGSIRRGGTIGVPAATAGVVALVATAPTAAEINQGSVTQRLREPYGGAAQSVFPLQLLAPLFLTQPCQPRQRSIKGLSLDGSGNHTVGRHNRCSRCNCWRRCSCRNRANRGRDKSGVCPSTAPGTIPLLEKCARV